MKKLLLASLLASAAVSAQTLPNTNTDAHTYEFVQSYDLVPPQGSKGETNLWVPLPFSNDYQTVQAVEFEGNYAKAYVTENNRYGAKTLYANWDANADKRLLKVKLTIETKDREPMAKGALKDYQVPEKIIY